jgi:hypothetical protein
MVEVRRQIIRYNGDDSAQDWTVVIVSSTGKWRLGQTLILQ